MTEKPSHHEKRSSLHVDQHKTKFSQGGFSAESGKEVRQDVILSNRRLRFDIMKGYANGITNGLAR